MLHCDELSSDFRAALELLRYSNSYCDKQIATHRIHRFSQPELATSPTMLEPNQMKPSVAVGKRIRSRRASEASHQVVPSVSLSRIHVCLLDIMRPPIRIAVLECDKPLDQTNERYGGYGGVFTALLHSAADAMQMARDDLDITKWDVVNDNGKYPKLDDIDAILMTGSSTWNCAYCSSLGSWLSSSS